MMAVSSAQTSSNYSTFFLGMVVASAKSLSERSGVGLVMSVVMSIRISYYIFFIAAAAAVEMPHFRSSQVEEES